MFVRRGIEPVKKLVTGVNVNQYESEYRKREKGKCRQLRDAIPGFAPVGFHETQYRGEYNTDLTNTQQEQKRNGQQRKVWPCIG